MRPLTTLATSTRPRMPNFCIHASNKQTVEEDLPQEIRFLHAFDKFSSAVKEIVEMPDREIEVLRGFLAQGRGHLSKRAREKEFRALTDQEATQVEVLYKELFGDFSRESGVNDV